MPAERRSKQNESFSDLLRFRREEAGLSQSELARKTRLNPSYISRIESGERGPSRREVVVAICDALCLDFEHRNELLMCAGYAPVTLADVEEIDPAMSLLADILLDPRIPLVEVDLLRQQLKQIQRRWLDNQTTEV